MILEVDSEGPDQNGAHSLSGICAQTPYPGGAAHVYFALCLP